MALDNPFKAASLGNSNRVDEIALGKEGSADHVAGFHIPGKVAELFDALDGRGVVLLEVAQHRLGEPLFFLVFKPKLHRFVAIGFDGLALDDPVGSREHHGHGHDHPLLAINAGVAQFFSEESKHKFRF